MLVHANGTPGCCSLFLARLVANVNEKHPHKWQARAQILVPTTRGVDLDCEVRQKLPLDSLHLCKKPSSRYDVQYLVVPESGLLNLVWDMA